MRAICLSPWARATSRPSARSFSTRSRAPGRLRTRNPPTRSDAEMTARHTSELEALLVDDAFDGDVYPNEPMSRHTMYRIGGPARFYVQVGSVGALKRLVETCERTGV